MTSANPHGEPLVIGNDEALARLSGIADAYLVHDRDIVVRCDDSVVRATPEGPGLHPPRPRLRAGADSAGRRRADRAGAGRLPEEHICVMKGREAFLSQHIGGLDNAAAIGFLEETVDHLLAILDVRPDLIAHDLHPDFPSTHLACGWPKNSAFRRSRRPSSRAYCRHLRRTRGQRADHRPGDGWGRPRPGRWLCLGWRTAARRWRRLPAARPPAAAGRLPGGDRAAREPWRMAVSALHGAASATASAAG
jgi:hydrogenase maturation protein HypF